MSRRERYLALLLAAAVLVGGWLYQQRAHWQQTYYDQAVHMLLYDLNRSRLQLERALAATDREEKAAAMLRAEGGLTSAMEEAYQLADVSRPPFRRGQPVSPWHDIMTYTNEILHYALDLTPDLTEQELRRRIDLLAGLEEAIKGGIDGEWSFGRTGWSVNRRRLMASWHGYISGLLTTGDRPDRFPRLEIWDPPVAGEVTARLQPVPGVEGVWEVVLDLRWERHFTVWPGSRVDYLLIDPARPFAAVEAVTSDRPPQDGLGRKGALAPVEQVEDDRFREGLLPEAWDAERAVALRVLEGLDQTVTLRVRTGEASPPDLEVHFLQIHQDAGREMTAVPLQ